ncbi:papilin-like [Hydractinia symbiolongicarpus]|uniref:papilin-like n=1 Tax=Hydractinia symbiolongicarpus TaxID=13093 RepID=UPI00254CAA9E|nr:papilin-like [Hydractinia symbiolongicarpus]
MIERCEKSIDDKGSYAALLTDLSKAFAWINYDLVIAKLHAYGFDKDALRLIHSPLLFKVFLIDLFLITIETDIASYADDNTPYTYRSDKNQVVEDLKKIAKRMFIWFAENDMKGNKAKSHLLFSLPLDTKAVVGDTNCYTEKSKTIHEKNIVTLAIEIYKAKNKLSLDIIELAQNQNEEDNFILVCGGTSTTPAFTTSHIATDDNGLDASTAHLSTTGTTDGNSLDFSTRHVSTTGTTDGNSLDASTTHASNTGTTDGNSLDSSTIHASTTSTTDGSSLDSSTTHASATSTTDGSSLNTSTTHASTTSTTDGSSLNALTTHASTIGTTHGNSLDTSTTHVSTTSTTDGNSLDASTTHVSTIGTTDGNSLDSSTTHASITITTDGNSLDASTIHFFITTRTVTHGITQSKSVDVLKVISS